MKVNDLNQALNEVDYVYLQEVDAPEKENQTMKSKKIRYVFLAAALICLMSITAYAADLLNIHSYMSGSSNYFQKYSQMENAMKKAGLQAEIPEEFQNGFRFQTGKNQDVDGMDENDQKVLTLTELLIYYQNEKNQTLTLRLMTHMDGLPKDERVPDREETVGEVSLKYYQDTYKFVPEDYQLSEEDEKWLDQPGHYLSYGADEVTESTATFLSWTNNGIDYSIMDWNTVEPDVLFEMAEEMLK